MGVISEAVRGEWHKTPQATRIGEGFTRYSTGSHRTRNREQKDLSFQKVTLGLMRGMDRELGSGLKQGVCYLAADGPGVKRLRARAGSRD